MLAKSISILVKRKNELLEAKKSEIEYNTCQYVYKNNHCCVDYPYQKISVETINNDIDDINLAILILGKYTRGELIDKNIKEPINIKIEKEAVIDDNLSIIDRNINKLKKSEGTS
jgi:hypothetical protein